MRETTALTPLRRRARRRLRPYGAWTVVPAAVLLLGSIGTSAASAGTGPGAAGPCAGTAPVRAVDLARQVAGAHLDDTVVLACRLATGRQVLDEGGIGAVVPRAGTTVHADSLGVTGSQEFSIESRADGTVALGSVGAEPAVASGGVTAREGSACTDGAHTGLGYVERDDHLWYINTDNLPTGLSAANAVASLRNGMNYLIAARTDCGIVPRYTTPPRATYLGLNSRHANITATRVCAAADNFSVVAFDGINDSGVLGQTCSWTSGGDVWESDTELNKNKRWFVNPPANCSDTYDIAGVTVHEVGHTFGLAHPAGSHPDLTMNAFLSSCTTYYRTLGRGDLAALETLY